MEKSTSARHSARSWSWPEFLLLVLVQLWLAHVLVFFAHEYAHSFTAFLLGWKADPLALHFPPSSLTVWLMQLGIDQNVDEAPIFAAGHGVDAGLIALAGPLLGNGIITYPMSRLAYVWAKRRGSRTWGMLAYWACTASVGNFIDYVPIRTFTLDGDMGSVQRGFGWSSWTVLFVLGTPTLLALAYFLLRIVPSTLRWLFPDSAAQRLSVVVLTVCILFGFFGAAGLSGSGSISHRLSMISVFGCLPSAVILSVVLAVRAHYTGPRRP